MEPSDLRGIPFRAGEFVERAAPAILPDAQRHGAQGILFLDEITSARQVSSAAAYQLILDRRLGEYQVPGRMGDLRRRQSPGRSWRDLHDARSRSPTVSRTSMWIRISTTGRLGVPARH